ncbi:hypothetical protein CCR75_003899 [Bremia lactucae]|uniref:Uncharacterized protein n=1 Tax=Bremia lactucae TaxID=4779 RepID=A0A976IBB1_BRELC|nr:hypothetical protein CCR75_003899 [Bremia lactucae]
MQQKPLEFLSSSKQLGCSQMWLRYLQNGEEQRSSREGKRQRRTARKIVFKLLLKMNDLLPTPVKKN